VDEIKIYIQESRLRCFGQTCDADDRREDTYENATYKNGGKTMKRKTQNQMDKPI
jgi:hypothetical protein